MAVLLWFLNPAACKKANWIRPIHFPKSES
jgi:hypothetical protein